MIPEALIALASGLTVHPLRLAGVIVLLALLQEEVATLVAASLVAAGLANVVLVLPVLLAGVLLGDLALVCLGRLGRAWLPASRFAQDNRVVRASGWLRKNLLVALALGRTVPGLRFPVYVAIGIATRLSLSTLLIGGGVAVAWTVGLFFLALHGTGLAVQAVGAWGWLALPVLLGGVILLQAIVVRAVATSRAADTPPPSDR